MSEKLRILISGDLFLKPQAFQEALQKRLAGEQRELEFRTVEYPYPVEALPLPDKALPTSSGGAWDGATSQLGGEAETEEVHEYYGEIDHFVGRVTDEDILIVHMSPITRAVLEAASNLKLIVCCRGGATVSTSTLRRNWASRLSTYRAATRRPWPSSRWVLCWRTLATSCAGMSR